MFIFDALNHELTLSGCWLRKRNQKWELKIQKRKNIIAIAGSKATVRLNMKGKSSMNSLEDWRIIIRKLMKILITVMLRNLFRKLHVSK